MLQPLLQPQDSRSDHPSAIPQGIVSLLSSGVNPSQNKEEKRDSGTENVSKQQTVPQALSPYMQVKSLPVMTNPRPNTRGLAAVLYAPHTHTLPHTLVWHSASLYTFLSPLNGLTTCLEGEEADPMGIVHLMSALKVFVAFLVLKIQQQASC